MVRLYDDDVDAELALPPGCQPVSANAHGQSIRFATGCIHVQTPTGDLTRYFVKVTNECRYVSAYNNVGLMMLQVRRRLYGPIPAGGRVPQPDRATDVRPRACAKPPGLGTPRVGYPRARMVPPYPVRGLSRRPITQPR